MLVVPEETLQSYVGRYAAGPGASIFVRLEDDGDLTIRVPGNVRFRCTRNPTPRST